MSKPAVADTEPFAFRQELQETIFEAIKGWEVRIPGKPLRGTTGGDAEAIAQQIREVYVDGLRASGSAGQHYLAMRGELVQAHNELDRVSIERSEEGAVHSLPHRVAILAGRYVDNQRRLAELGAARATAETGPRGEDDSTLPNPPGDGWQGQLPAEGTRRRLIFETIMRDRVFRTVGAPAASTALRLADLIEEALLAPRRAEPSREYREDDDRPVIAEASAELPKPLFGPGDEIELIEDRDLALDLPEGTVGVVIPDRRRWCGRCQEWHYGVRFEGDDREARVAEQFMRHARGEEATEKEDGRSGELNIKIGDDGYPWIDVLGLIGLLENLGMVAYRDEEVAEPGPEPGEVCEEEIDPDVPLWKVEASRAFNHVFNAARLWLRV